MSLCLCVFLSVPLCLSPPLFLAASLPPITSFFGREHLCDRARRGRATSPQASVGADGTSVELTAAAPSGFLPTASSYGRASWPVPLPSEAFSLFRIATSFADRAETDPVFRTRITINAVAHSRRPMTLFFAANGGNPLIPWYAHVSVPQDYMLS